MIAVLLLLAALGGQAHRLPLAQEMPASCGVTRQAAPLPLSALENFTFDLGPSASVEGGRVTLVNGRWADPVGGSSFELHRLRASGDFDGDAAADTVVVLVETAGTGVFSYLFAIGNEGGRPVQRGEPEWLGDRSVIERLSIDRRGIVAVRYVTHKDGDPVCCPTLRIEDRYRVVDGQLQGITK